MAYTNVSGKMIQQAWGKFRGKAYVALKVGDLVGRDTTNDGWILAHKTSGAAVVAEAVALDTIAAGSVGWMALAVVIKAPPTEGAGGVMTEGVLALAGDLCSPLYLSTSGTASTTAGAGADTVQQVGFILATGQALLMPNVGLTGADINATTLTLSGLATVGGVSLVTATNLTSADGMLVALKALAEKMTQTAKTDTVTLTAAELLTKVIDGTPTAAAQYTLPTAALLVAAIPGAAVGSSFMFFVNNKSAGAYTITVAAGSGGTGDGTLTVAQHVVRSFLVIITNVTGAAEAYFVYGIG